MSDELDDLIDDPSSPLSGLSYLRPASSFETPEYLKKQFELGQRLEGEPDELIGGLDKAQAARRKTSADKIALIEQATRRLAATAPDAGPDRVNLPLLAAGSAMLQPTNGGFFSALGNAGRAALPVLQEQRQREFQHANAMNGIDLQRASAIEEAGGLDYNDLVNRVGLGQKISAAAANADARRAAAQARAGIALRPQAKVVPGVGLVEITTSPDGKNVQQRILVQSKDPWSDPKVEMAFRKMIQKETDNYNWSSPEQRLAYESDLLQTMLNSRTNYDPALVRRDISLQGVKPRSQTAAPGGGAAPAAPAPGASSLSPPTGAPGATTPATPGASEGPLKEDADSALTSPPGPGLRRTPYSEARDKKAGAEDADLAAKDAQAARTEADAALGTLSTNQSIRALDSPTGRLAPAKQWLGSWAEALGIQAPKMIKDANSLAAFNAVATNVVLDKQIAQKGVQTEGDAQRMRDTYAQIKNPKEANDLILRHAEALAKRAADKSAFIENWHDANDPASGKARNHYVGSKAAWQKFIKEVPLVKKINGKTIFFNEWVDKARELNPDEKDIDTLAIDDWKKQGG